VPLRPPASSEPSSQARNLHGEKADNERCKYDRRRPTA
jgi:hypothetical protein